jgi:hypothetical protein
MRKASEVLRELPVLSNRYVTSFLESYRERRLFDDVTTFVMFMGYPRSGHSLVGALLDAHPNIIVAHELGVLKYILARFSKRQIYYLLLENSRVNTERGRTSGAYSYRVPNQWQGRFKKLRVIGDKQGLGANLRFQARPWLLGRLRRTIDCNIKFIHIIRNPYDNIGTISRTEKRDKPDLKDSIQFYFSLCKGVEDVKKQLDRDEILEFRHESFIDDPRSLLSRILSFIGEEASDDYLADCESIVFRAARKTRYDTKWNRECIDIVLESMAQFSFLEGYSYKD